MTSPRILSAALLVPLLAGCSVGSASDPVEVRLHAAVPDDSTRMMWSPKGMQLPLVPSQGGLETLLALGPAGTAPIGLRLERSGKSPYYDRLRVDVDRNGSFDEPPIETEPSEIRGRVWSSFDAMLTVPVIDPVTGRADEDPYPVAFWYVFDPMERPEQEVIRMSRRGWMEGDTIIDGTPVRVLLTEYEMDGIYDERDQWAIAPLDSARLVYRDSRSLDRHNWLGEDAWRVVSVDPSGRRVELETGDVGITRAEEAAQLDRLAPDRNAAHSGSSVPFENDFEAAMARAAEEGKSLFVDFRTVWCGPCYTMDELVFTADTVVAAAVGVVPVRVDGDERRDLTKRLEVAAYPTLLMLGPDGEEIGRHVGYLGVDSTALFLRRPFGRGTD